MKHEIEGNENSLDINVDDLDENKGELLGVFQACQQGRYSCPSEEYEKLDSLEIEDNEDGIQLRLKSKDGTKIDKNEISKCLEHTAKSINKE